MFTERLATILTISCKFNMLRVGCKVMCIDKPRTTHGQRLEVNSKGELTKQAHLYDRIWIVSLKDQAMEWPSLRCMQSLYL